MPRFSSLFAPIRRSLLERPGDPFDRDPFESLDPFRPLDEVRKKRPPVSLPLAAPVGPPGLPKTRNRADDVGRVEAALGRAGNLGGERRNPVFDTRLETRVRDFQRRKGLKADGLLNPGGPTIRALGRAVARPPLKGLSGAAVSANARLVRHLMTTTADGIVPGLMADDFKLGEAGRAKTADFLSQLFGRDPARAKSLRAKAKARMAADEKGLLDKLILQARLFEDDDPGDDDDDDGDEQPPEEEPPPDEPEEPPHDPDHPRPGDPDDPDEDEDPDEPDEPEKPKPPEPDCEAEEEAVAAAQSDVDAAEAELADMQQQAQATKDRVAEVEKEIQKTNEGIEELKKMIAEDEAIIDYNRRIKDSPFFGRHGPFLDASTKDRQKRIRDNEEQLKKSEAELKALRKELSELNETLSQLERQVAEAEKTLEEKKRRLAEAQSILEACQDQ